MLAGRARLLSTMTTQVSAALRAKIDGKLAARQAAIPPEYTVHAEQLGVPASFPAEQIPRPTSKTQPWELEPTTAYPADNVLDVPAQVLSADDLAIVQT